MSPYNILIVIFWLIFLVYWGYSAIGAKKTTHRRFAPRIILVIIFIVGLNIPAVRYFFVAHNIASSNPFVESFGVLLCALGIILAIFARVYIGKNWGMPMSEKEDAELVTTGPYAYVRHPIYSGAILAMFGSSLVAGTWWFAFFLFLSVYFIYSAGAEEKLLERQFPKQYPEYKKRTKMLVPFLF